MRFVPVSIEAAHAPSARIPPCRTRKQNRFIYIVSIRRRTCSGSVCWQFSPHCSAVHHHPIWPDRNEWPIDDGDIRLRGGCRPSPHATGTLEAPAGDMVTRKRTDSACLAARMPRQRPNQPPVTVVISFSTHPLRWPQYERYRSYSDSQCNSK